MRFVSRGLVAIAIALAGANACTTGANAQTVVQKCKFDENGVERCQLVVSPPVEPPRIVPLGESTLVWQSLNLGIFPVSCPPRTAPNGAVVVGFLWQWQITDSRTGAVVGGGGVCQYPGDPPPAPPPAPPSPAEFAESADQALKVVPLSSPSAVVGGITGLDTWLWCEHPREVTVQVVLRGWTARADVALTGVRFVSAGTETSTGGDGATFDSVACGSSERPSALWMPDRKGAHSLTSAATWAGSWTLSFNGQFTTAPGPLGPVTLTSAPVAYPVREVRAVLVSPSTP
jgi:hypothetical protein